MKEGQVPHSTGIDSDPDPNLFNDLTDQ